MQTAEHPVRGPAMTLDDLLTLPEAAELVDRPPDCVARRVKRGDLAVSVRRGTCVVAVRELVRIGWLDSSGRRWELPEKLGLPLLVPLDAEQMLTKQEISDLVGAPFNTVALWVQRGKFESTLCRGWPSGGKGPRERRLVSVGELVAKGWLTAEGEPGRLSREDPRPRTVLEPVLVPWRPKPVVRQRSIPDDLPTDLTDERIGISDPEMAALVLVGLSRFIAADGSRRGDGSYRALRLLRLYAHTEVVRAGVLSAAPCPDVDPKLPIPTGRTVTEHLGLPARYRADEWARLADADCVAAHFDVSYVAHYVPPALWRVFAAMVVDGPKVANARLARIIYAESVRSLEKRWSERDEDATMAVATLQGHVSTFRRFYSKALVSMRTDGYPSSLLDAWTHVPPTLPIKASSWRADRSAPARSLLRLAWQRADANLKERLARAMSSADDARPSQDIDDFDALQLVSRLPRYRLRDAGVFRAARNRALLTMFVTLGGRKEATMDLA